MNRFATLTASIFLAATTAATAQDMISATNAIDVAEALRDLGYRAQLKKDSLGDPMVSSKAAGLNFTVFYYGCKDGSACKSVQLSASFTLDDTTPTPDLNDWNTKKRYGKANFNEDGDIVLRYDINMSGEGISLAAFTESINLWESLLNDFKEHIDF